MNHSSPTADWDVAIIGGGPGGSTTGTLLKKYRPGLRVLVLERETFPREHIGESQLPAISDVLAEMGCWDKVEAADFPIKVGATFRWGRTPELWDFEFLPLKDFKSDARPGRYEGSRRQTAFQVERAVYDDILLRHAAETGCVVRQGVGVARVDRFGDRVDGLVLSTGETVTARHYVDASGNAAVLRRAMGVAVDCPTHLKNIAIWDYWENADWAVEIGVGGTRIQVMSLGYGWLWFIPLGPTRTSLGLVCPAEYYKAAGKSPEELYAEAVRSEARIARLVANGTRSGRVRTTTDWSFLADRTVGENWFLVGEAAGFADPILSAGMTLTHTGGRELAYTLLALLAGEHDPEWLKTHYDRLQRGRVRQHIRFADFWYAANGQFTDLAEHCRAIARDAGLDLTAEQAWAWLARGGFATDVAGQAGLGGYSLAAVKGLTSRFTDAPAVWKLNDVNVLRIDLAGATQETVPVYAGGKITPAAAYHRGGHRLVATGLYDALIQMLARPTDVGEVVRLLNTAFAAKMTPAHARVALQHAMQTLEVMLSEGWVRGTLDASKPRLTLSTPREGEYIHPNRDEPV